MASMWFSLLCFAAVLAISSTQDILFMEGNTDDCITPSGQPGECILLQKCQYLLNLLLQRPRPPGAINYLRRTQCGVEGRFPLVCCAGDGRLPPWAPTTPAPTPPPPPPPPISKKPDNLPLLNHPNLRLLPLEDCGVDYSERIFGGEVTSLDEYPWLALLRYRSPRGSLNFLCGGVLINRRYVLTASHCINGDLRGNTLVSVRLGEYDTTTDIDCVEELTGDMTCAPPPVDVEIEQQIPHPEYSRFMTNQYNDIGLLRLAQDVRFTEYIKPICLPVTETLLRELRVGENLTVSGWGRTENRSFSPVKLKVNVPLVSLRDCYDVYRRNSRELRETQMCAGGVQGKDSCTGDSGGPLMKFSELNGNAVHFVAGVVSFGPRDCGMAGWPGVYTRVSAYLRWILDELQP
ncbi:phenoloxidase-activating enzyme 1 isoform X2 [Anabrus simplex]|uniref:phenoloxidase-activating enzyme 1 isoform X2 n=1 Tax=Anabrus simplex TaxID=316456 RepID=UPI0034DD2C85